MADGRMLKRAVSDSRRLSELKSDSARLLWTWILPYLDIEGRYFADPDILKGKIVPRIKTFTPSVISGHLEDMRRVGLIVLYEHDKEKYLQFRNFQEFQNLREDRERKSKIPPPGELPENSRITPDEYGNTPIEVKLREDKIREKKSIPLPLVKMKFADSVFLSATEHQKLTEAIGQKNLEIGIDRLDYSITVKGGKYKDHYKTILNWHKRGFLKGNESRPIQSGERDIPLYVGEPMPDVSDEQRKANIEKIKQFTTRIG